MIGTPRTVKSFCQKFDQIVLHKTHRVRLRQYLTGLVAPGEHKDISRLSEVTAVDLQALHHFLVNSNWDDNGVNESRIKMLQQNDSTRATESGVLIVDDTGDKKKGNHTDCVARQYIGRLGKVDNGIVCVTTHYADSKKHYPLSVEIYTPESRLEGGKSNPEFATKPQIALKLIDRAIGLGVRFCAVVTDCFYGSSEVFLDGLFERRLKFVVALRPSQGAWHKEGEEHPLCATVEFWNKRGWRVLSYRDADGKLQKRYVAQCELGDCQVVMVTREEANLENADVLLTNLNRDALEVARLYYLRNWVEVFYKQAKNQFGWSDFQVRDRHAIIRHWILVLCAWTICMRYALSGGVTRLRRSGEKIRTLAAGNEWDTGSASLVENAHRYLASCAIA